MRRVLILAGSAALVVAAGVAVAVMLVSAESYRATIERQASAELGHPVRIAGPMRFTLDPSIAIEMDDVMVADAAQDADRLAHAGRVVASVELLPLFTGDVRVSRLTLVGADIRMPESGLRAVPGSAGDPFAALGIESLHLVDSVVALGREREIKADDLIVSWTRDGDDLSAQGRLTWRNRAFDIEATIGQRAALMSDTAVPLRIAFKSPLGRGVLDGVAALVAGHFDGTVNLTAPSARRLAIFLGTRLPGDRGLGAFSLAANARITAPDRLMLTEAKFTLDTMTGGGMMEMARSADGRLKLDGAVSVDQLDVTAYVTLEEPETAPETVDESAGWSEARMDLASLASFDAEVQVMARRLSLGGIRLQKVTGSVALKDGVADVDMASGTVYGGLARGRLKVDARAEAPSLDVSLQVLGFDAQAFFADAIDSTALNGRGDLALALSSTGASRKELVSHLGGSVEMKITDGMLNGVDLGGVARSVLASTGPAGLGEGDGTSFTALDAKLTLADGRATIRDLSVTSPFLRSKIEGGFGLVARTMRISVKPRGVGGIYGEEDGTVTGFPMPFAATGPWDAPTVVPDWAALAAMLDAAEVTTADLNALPEPSRAWFLDQVNSGTPFPALPDIAGSEPATDLR